MSTIIDIAIDPPVLLKPLMKIGEILSIMSEHRIRVTPVVDDRNVLVGVLSYRAILMKGVGRETKVATVMDPPYSINMNESIDKAIAVIASWRARDVPIVDEDNVVVGHVNLHIVLKYLYEKNLVPRETVDKVMSSPAVTIQEWESIARARWLMLKNAFSRLPVVNRFEKITGVITLSDIVERLYRIKLSRRKGYEWIESEESFLAAPVSDFMSSPPITTIANSSLSNAVKLLIDNRITGIPVITEDNRIVGVLSGIDILKKYVEKSATIYPIEASISKAVEGDEVAKVYVERIVNSYLADISRYLNIIDFKLAVKPLKKSDTIIDKDVRKMYEVSARIVTNIGDSVARSSCWDLPTCIREVMEILSKRLRKRIEKGMQKRERYRKYET
ncbi:MAG: CBS domain-containing protein [Ignisphaera sp.]|uniref:CBS domain-containing protein n=1 Tax=Ignisphaera aggregans TaxID=334771 RepID=A0A7J3MXD3_9CREN